MVLSQKEIVSANRIVSNAQVGHWLLINQPVQNINMPSNTSNGGQKVNLMSKGQEGLRTIFLLKIVWRTKLFFRIFFLSWIQRGLCKSDNLNLIFDIQFSQIKVISKKIRFETKLQVYSNLTQLQYSRAFMSQQCLSIPQIQPRTQAEATVRSTLIAYNKPFRNDLEIKWN